MRTSEYIQTDAGRLSRYNLRYRRRLSVHIKGIEPRAKGSMPLAEKLEVQRQVLAALESSHRRAYRGPVVLHLRVATTESTPAHAPAIAKNMLDLLGQPLQELPTERKGLLYFDDFQVHGLSVSCTHGAKGPEILIGARSLGDFRDDLELAAHVLSTERDLSNGTDASDDAVLDLRRTAARDFRRAWVSEGEIMRLGGWRTRSMFDQPQRDRRSGPRVRRRAPISGKVVAKSEAPATLPDSLSSSRFD